MQVYYRKIMPDPVKAFLDELLPMVMCITPGGKHKRDVASYFRRLSIR